MSSRKQHQLPVESSWRLVEGEGDSFDTSIVQGGTDDDEINDVVLSTDPSTQMSSQGQMSTSSQDSIQAFLRRADEEQVILRNPFPPTIPSARQTTPRARDYQRDDNSNNNNPHRTPDPEFIMPPVDVQSPRRGTGGGSGTRTSSSRTARQASAENQTDLRRRPQTNSRYNQLSSRTVDARGSPTKRRTDVYRGQRLYRGGGDYLEGEDSDESPPPPLSQRPGRSGRDDDGSGKSLGDRIQAGLMGGLVETAAWLFTVVGLALRYAQRPLAFLLAVYLMFGAAIVAQNMVTKSIYTSLSPLCRIPGTSYLDLPFCPKNPETKEPGDRAKGTTQAPVEFDELVKVQSQFEAVLEESAQGVSLPLDMKRSEASIRDLRTMVRYSDLQARDELVLEFDAYIDAVRSASAQLQRFNSHVGSAVDAVISINRWTSRYLDSMAQSERETRSLASDLTSWIFAPFLPPAYVWFDERALTDKYVEHTALVSDRIAALILEAQEVLRTLGKAEDHLSLIYDVTTRSSQSVHAKKNEILWTLWTLVGGNSRRLHNLNTQLGLLRKVDAQRTDAVRRLGILVVDLEKIQAGLADLRDRVAQPELIRDRAEVPLSVHIETIDRGIERLENARKRIRAVENERIREALAKGGATEERLIEGS